MQFSTIDLLKLHELTVPELVRHHLLEDGVLFVRAGTGTLAASNGQYLFAPNSSFFLSQASSFCADFSAASSVIWCQVKINYVDLHQALYGAVLPLPAAPQLCSAIANYQQRDSQSQRYLQQVLEALLFDAAQVRKPGAQENVSEDAAIVRQLDTFIEAHLCESFSVPVLAGSVGYTAKLLNAFLKRNFDCTAMEYVNRYKISKSKILLLCSEKSITDIAYECGFQSLHYYSRFFKQMVGVSPQYFQQTGGRIR